jgi:hypothetical protein
MDRVFLGVIDNLESLGDLVIFPFSWVSEFL